MLLVERVVFLSQIHSYVHRLHAFRVIRNKSALNCFFCPFNAVKQVLNGVAIKKHHQQSVPMFANSLIGAIWH